MWENVFKFIVSVRNWNAYSIRFCLSQGCHAASLCTNCGMRKVFVKLSVLSFVCSRIWFHWVNVQYMKTRRKLALNSDPQIQLNRSRNFFLWNTALIKVLLSNLFKNYIENIEITWCLLNLCYIMVYAIKTFLVLIT